VNLPGWYPQDPADPNGIHTGTDVQESEQVFRELRDAYAAHIRKVRKKLGLTQESAGHIIGGGKRAFQKYESGKMVPSDAAIGLIDLLDRHPEDVERLRAIRG
jgi:HTH-type transcriptional regulator / antitoxin MqsA